MLLLEVLEGGEEDELRMRYSFNRRRKGELIDEKTIIVLLC